MNSLYRVLTLALVLGLPSASFAQVAEQKADPKAEEKASGKAVETKEGGKTTLRLADILDKTVCSYRNTDALLQQFKLKAKVDQILNALFQIHPYMAYKIRRDMDQQQWCLTSKLKFVTSDDEDKVTDSYVPEVQIAIREITPNKVYLDVPKFTQMPEDDRAMTLIHETMHSFLEKNLAMRNANVRAICKAIYEHYIDTKKGSQFAMREQIANLNVTLKATTGLAAFETVEFGRTFWQAAVAPSVLTEEQFQTLTKKTVATESVPSTYVHVDAIRFITNEIGQARFAGRMLQSRLDYPDFPVWTQAETIRANIASEYESSSGNRDSFANAAQVQVGGCDFTKKGTGFYIGSAGFLSATGYNAKFDLEIALRRHNSKSLLEKRVMNREESNHTILVAAPLDSGLRPKANAVMDEWEKKIVSIGQRLSQGACNDFQAPGLKYFR
jgi:hypothetical protein